MLSIKGGFLFFALVSLLIGCEGEVLHDYATQIKLPTVKAEDENLVMLIQYDGMLGYENFSREELVIDTNYYKTHSLQRGDVVYLEKDPSLHKDTDPLLRVIALEGETLRIHTGQIYIDDKKLDTFYGRPAGPGLNELKKEYREAYGLEDYEKQNLSNRIKNFQNDNLESLKIPQGSVYLMGDNRWRAWDSQVVGPIPIKGIVGKVSGFLEKHPWKISSSFAISKLVPEGSHEGKVWQLRGERGRFAINNKPVFAGVPFRTPWFFWGTSEELAGSPKIIAVRENNEKDRKVVFAAGGVSGPLAGANGHIPTGSMTLPEPGLWRLEAYIGDPYFGSIVVNVEAK
ncbi:signal peptidase I [Paenibacillus eucommiae]|uniref:Signal peptidase I n=1 Tax=Paenibacillus eucommiae TaxID=1355755 RepID=A0ABS4ITV1_9BACL|nr:signal peptidase I [Paenibacillus eucommiae]MBP1991011.1 signal peptidase I [Paenibacillus eucommiae]